MGEYQHGTTLERSTDAQMGRPTELVTSYAPAMLLCCSTARNRTAVHLPVSVCIQLSTSCTAQKGLTARHHCSLPPLTNWNHHPQFAATKYRTRLILQRIAVEREQRFHTHSQFWWYPLCTGSPSSWTSHHFQTSYLPPHNIPAVYSIFQKLPDPCVACLAVGL